MKKDKPDLKLLKFSKEKPFLAGFLDEQKLRDMPAKNLSNLLNDSNGREALVDLLNTEKGVKNTGILKNQISKIGTNIIDDFKGSGDFWKTAGKTTIKGIGAGALAGVGAAGTIAGLAALLSSRKRKREE